MGPYQDRAAVDDTEDQSDVYGFYIPFDEFNTLIYANLLAKKLKARYPQLKLVTCTFRPFASLFGEFDELLFFEWETTESPIDVTANEPTLRTKFMEQAHAMLLERDLRVPPQLLGIQREITDALGPELHRQVFGLLAEQLLYQGSMLNSSVLEKNRVSEFLKKNQVAQGFIVVIGRNRDIHRHHNNTLLRQISDSIDKDLTVVNATFPPPGLQANFPDKYVEINSEQNDYGFTIALMESASMTYIFGNAGGGSIHLMTNAPITLVGPLNWINSLKYSFRGITLLAARRRTGLKTLHTWSGISPILRLKSYLRLFLDALSFMLNAVIKGLSINNHESDDKTRSGKNANTAA